MKFPDISYENWLAKVKKELKTENLDSHFVKLNTDLRTDPFFERIPNTGKAVRIERTWRIKQIFDGESTNNSEILTSLEGGINYVEIIHAESIVDLETLLAGIELNFIHLHLTFTRETASDKVQAVLGNYGTHNHLSYHIENSPIADSIARVRFTIGQDDDIVDGLSSICNKIIDFIDAGKTKSDCAKRASNVEIERKISTSIILEIAYHQAMKLLWSNILHGFDLSDIPLETLASCRPTDIFDLEKNYIALSSKGLTAVIAGYSTVYIAPASIERKSFHDRISRNIHHLLQAESFIQKSSEGMNGSYQIDKIAHQIAIKVWDRIQA